MFCLNDAVTQRKGKPAPVRTRRDEEPEFPSGGCAGALDSLELLPREADQIKTQLVPASMA